MDADDVAALKEEAETEGLELAKLVKAHEEAIHEMRHKVFTQKKALEKATKAAEGGDDDDDDDDDMVEELDAFDDDDDDVRLERDAWTQ